MGKVMVDTQTKIRTSHARQVGREPTTPPLPQRNPTLSNTRFFPITNQLSLCQSDSTALHGLYPPLPCLPLSLPFPDSAS